MHASAENVFAILRLVSAAEEPLGVAEVARRSKLPVSTAHRALATLELAGYLRRLEKSKFELGPRAEKLVFNLFRRFAIGDASLPYLQQLSAASGETTSLWASVGWYIVRLASIAGAINTVRRARKLGQPALLHTDSGASAILASLGDAEREGYLAFTGRHHPRLLDDARARLAACRATRRRSWIFDARPKEGIYTLSFPLRAPDGSTTAAISVEGPSLRRSQWERSGRISDWAEIVRRLQGATQAKPEIFANPYAHIPRDRLIFPE